MENSLFQNKAKLEILARQMVKLQSKIKEYSNNNNENNTSIITNSAEKPSLLVKNITQNNKTPSKIPTPLKTLNYENNSRPKKKSIVNVPILRKKESGRTQSEISESNQKLKKITIVETNINSNIKTNNINYSRMNSKNLSNASLNNSNNTSKIISKPNLKKTNNYQNFSNMSISITSLEESKSSSTHNKKSINISKSESKIGQNLYDISQDYEIEILYPDDSSNATEKNTISKKSINSKKISRKNITKKIITKNNAFYEREMKNLKIKSKKLDIKRQKIENEKLKELQSAPEVNEHSENIIKYKVQNKEYIPIQKRAIYLHNQHLTKILINEENKKLEQKIKEEVLLEKSKKLYAGKNKIYDEKEWNDFVERQNLWKNELLYKRKKAQILKNEYIEKQNTYIPKINNKSKSMIDCHSCIDLNNGNIYSENVKGVFSRLFNDFEEHQQRQKLRNQISMPTFKPFIYKNKYKKSLNKSFVKNESVISNAKKKLRKCSSNPQIIIENNKTMEIDNNNNLNKNIFSQKLFTEKNNSSFNSFLSNLENKFSKKNFKFKNVLTKSQGPTQPTNNNTNVNCTEINTDIVDSKLIYSERPFTISNQYYNNLNIKNKSIKDKINEIKNESNYNDDEEEDEESKNDKNNISYYNESKNGSIHINTKSFEVKDNFKINEKLMEDLEDAKNKYKIDFTLNDSENKKNEDSLYKLNIRNITPTGDIKEDIVIANKKYQQFFNISDSANEE